MPRTTPFEARARAREGRDAPKPNTMPRGSNHLSKDVKEPRMAEAINNYHPDALPTIRSSAAEAIRRMIFQGTLRRALEVGGCMERLVVPPSSSAAISKFPYPIYVAHAKRLRRRREHITKQLAAIGAGRRDAGPVCGRERRRRARRSRLQDIASAIHENRVVACVTRAAA